MTQNKNLLTAFVILSLFSYKLVNSQISKCNTNPCKNGGRCVDQPNTAYGYSCLCNNPWMGVNCDQSANNQQNNGIFPNNLGGYNNNNLGYNNNFGGLNPAFNQNNNPSYSNNNNNNNNLGFNTNTNSLGFNNNNNNNQGFNNILGTLGSPNNNNNNQGFFNNPGSMNINNKNNNNNPLPWNNNNNNNNNNNLFWNNNNNNNNPSGLNTVPNYKTIAWNNDRNTSPLYNFGGWDQRASTLSYNSGNMGLANNNQISGCSSSPCLNGATCQPYGPWGFKCSCGPNYYGYRCERFYKAIINGAENLANQTTKFILIMVSLICLKTKMSGILV